MARGYSGRWISEKVLLVLRRGIREDGKWLCRSSGYLFFLRVERRRISPLEGRSREKV